MAPQAMVDLGFTPERFPAGTHICQIYNDEDERNDALLRYLASGLRAGECRRPATALDLPLSSPS